MDDVSRETWNQRVVLFGSPGDAGACKGVKRVKAERAAIRDSGIAPTFRAAPCVKRVKAERAAMSHE